MNSFEEDLTLGMAKELAEPLKKAVSPLATEIGETLAAVWRIVFGLIGYTDARLQARWTANLEAYKNSLRDLVVKIPEANRIEPRLSIVGPALEASKFYIDEEFRREMFATLIAKAMNKDTAESIQDSFVELIKQLGTNDIEVLKYLISTNYIHNTSIWGVAYIIVYDSEEDKRKKTPYSYLIPLLFSRYSGNSDFTGALTKELLDKDTLSLNNLIRLGLFEINPTVFVLRDKRFYQVYDNSKLYKDYKEQLGDLVELKYNSVRLTKFGLEFIKICFG